MPLRLILLLLFWPVTAAAQHPEGNVVLIMLDGVRWQEVFTGADSLLMHSEHGGIDDTVTAQRQFWRPTAGERRRILMPFLWDSVAKNGQVLGDATHGSIARVTNGYNFSYPGYNEVLTGRGDPRINTNAYPPNPNVTVFEWLGRQPGLEGKVAAFGTWDAFPRIFNRERAGIHLWAGWEEPFPAARDSAASLLNELANTTTRIWDDLSYDAFMQIIVRDYVAREHPRLLFVGFGETDVWAHDGKYDKLLRSAQQDDAFIAELWHMMQEIPQYRGKTTFIITTDHGRGDGPDAWRDHGQDVPGADRIWIAVMGPGIAPLGARSSVTPVTQGQVAATIAALLGADFPSADPGVAPSMLHMLQEP